MGPARAPSRPRGWGPRSAVSAPGGTRPGSGRRGRDGCRPGTTAPGGPGPSVPTLWRLRSGRPRRPVGTPRRRPGTRRRPAIPPCRPTSSLRSCRRCGRARRRSPGRRSRAGPPPGTGVRRRSASPRHPGRVRRAPARPRGRSRTASVPSERPRRRWGPSGGPAAVASLPGPCEARPTAGRAHCAWRAPASRGRGTSRVLPGCPSCPPVRPSAPVGRSRPGSTRQETAVRHRRTEAGRQLRRTRSSAGWRSSPARASRRVLRSCRAEAGSPRPRRPTGLR
jgi:hypothetical protein